MDFKELFVKNGKANRILPLYTKAEMAKRWGVKRQTVDNWERRNPEFCKPIEGVVANNIKYYPLYEVERFEEANGLKK